VDTWLRFHFRFDLGPDLAQIGVALGSSAALQVRRSFRGLGLEESLERKIVIFFLVSLAVCVGAEFSPTGPPLEERELLAAIQTPHEALIVLLPSLRKS
jgi:hypothetical protein